MKSSRINRRKKTTYEIVKTWMSSFVFTVVAVVAATLFIPKSPEATLLKVTALENQITYQVKVTDEEHALDLNTLKVVLENQLERYEESISLGENTGYFEGLSPNTDYKLSIYGSKGFGLERLDTRMVRTKSLVGGFILGYQTIGDTVEPSYEVEVYIYDPNHRYQSITLYYGYGYDNQFFYDSIPITLTREKVELFHLFSKTHVYLEALTTEGVIVLDEMWITPRFELMSSFQIEYINRYTMGYTIYNSSVQNVEVTYQVDLYEGSNKRQMRIIQSSEFDTYSKTFTVENLKELTQYRLIIQATYINPDTLRPETIELMEQEFMTLGEYSVDYEMINHKTYLEVLITVIDPSHYFQVPYYEVYDVSNEYPVWISSDVFEFTSDINSKSVTFTIDLPNVEHYQQFNREIFQYCKVY